MTTDLPAFPWRAQVQKGSTGTIRVHRRDSDFGAIPATVVFHRPRPNGLDVIEVQHDAVAEDGQTITRNIAGPYAWFRRNRRGRWISLDRQPHRYTGTPAYCDQFEPGPQRYEPFNLDIPF